VAGAVGLTQIVATSSREPAFYEVTVKDSHDNRVDIIIE
jgi:D-aminopeptidase